MANDAEVRIRIFGSKDCEKCEALKKLYTSFGLGFDFVDANADVNDALCDQYDVDQLPHVQAYRVASGKVIVNHKGFISPTDLTIKMKDVLTDNPGSRNRQIKGQRSNTGRRCGNCYDE